MAARGPQPVPTGAILCVLGILYSGAFSVPAAQQPLVPKAWDARELASFELPLVRADRSAQHAAPEYYYRLAVRPIYKSYPIYAPGHEPAGYMEWLAQQEPEIAFDPSRLQSDADWVAAGEAVFDAPFGYGATFKVAGVRDRGWYERNQIPVTRDGVMPFSRYVIRKKGLVEVGSGSCLMCHARVMPDGTLLKGAQGNFPADRIVADNLRQQATATKDAIGSAGRRAPRPADVLCDAVVDAGSDRAASPRCRSTRLRTPTTRCRSALRRA